MRPTSNQAAMQREAGHFTWHCHTTDRHQNAKEEGNRQRSNTLKEAKLETKSGVY